MIVDFHAHIFPPHLKADRSGYLQRDPLFREMYGSPRARIATAEDLLASMDRAGIDVSVVQGFPWRSLDDCREINAYILDAATRYGGRLLPFCTVPPFLGEESAVEAECCAAAGARGLGEMRAEPGQDGGDLERFDAVAAVCRSQKLVLLFHSTEPVGRWYPGKGSMTPDVLYRLAVAYPDLPVVGAHLGGGLPFYASLPDVRLTLSNFYVDTAAWPLLYRPEVFPALEGIFGMERVLFGSDYPVLGQGRALARTRDLGLGASAERGLLGANAARLLGLEL